MIGAKLALDDAISSAEMLLDLLRAARTMHEAGVEQLPIFMVLKRAAVIGQEVTEHFGIALERL